MTEGKRRPDGSKRRTSSREKTRVPEPVHTPPAPGYVRKESGAVRGATNSVGEFIIQAFARLAEDALKSFDEQRGGASDENGFNSHGSAEFRFAAGEDSAASCFFEIHGLPPHQPDFQTWLRDINATGKTVFESSAGALALTLAERTQTLATRGEEVIHGQLDAELLHPFALVSFVRVRDPDLLIRVRFELRPSRALPEHRTNRPDLS